MRQQIIFQVFGQLLKGMTVCFTIQLKPEGVFFSLCLFYDRFFRLRGKA